MKRLLEWAGVVLFALFCCVDLTGCGRTVAVPCEWSAAEELCGKGHHLVLVSGDSIGFYAFGIDTPFVLRGYPISERVRSAWVCQVDR